MGSKHGRCATLVLAGLLGFPAIGGPRGVAFARQVPQGTTPVFGAAVTLTRVRAAVVDSAGRAVPGLGVADFKVLEAGIEQPVQVVLAPRIAPLELAVVLDFSGSIAEDWPQARTEIRRFLDALDDNDCMYVLPFNSRVGPGVWGGPDSPSIRQLVDRFPLQGRTRLYDALQQALGALDDRSEARRAACGPDPDAGGVQRRRALVTLSDGMDEGSDSTYSETLVGAWRASVPTFPVAVGTAAISAADLRGMRDHFDADDFVTRIRSFQAQLREMARVSGGSFVDQRDLGDAYQELLSLLRSYYVIGYRSTQEGATGWQPVEVSTRDSRHRVLAQPGLYRSQVDLAAARDALAAGREAFQKRQFDTAEHWFSIAAGISAEVGRPYFGRGLALEAAGQLSAAREEYRRSLRHSPGVAATHVRLATVALALGDRDAAHEHAVRAAIAGADVAALASRMAQRGVPVPGPGELRRPVIYILSPEVPTLEQQLVMRRIQRAVGAAIDAMPGIALTRAYPRASAYLVTHADRHEAGPPEALRLRLELFDVGRNRLWSETLTIDDLVDQQALSGAASSLAVKLATRLRGSGR